MSEEGFIRVIIKVTDDFDKDVIDPYVYEGVLTRCGDHWYTLWTTPEDIDSIKALPGIALCEPDQVIACFGKQ